MAVEVAVVVEVEDLSARRLARVGVVRVTAVPELAERRGRAEERDAVVARFEVLVDMAREHDAHRAAAKHPKQTIAADQPAVELRARRPRRMMQSEHDMRRRVIEPAPNPRASGR